LLLIADAVVASGDPAGLWQVVLDKGGDAYVATLRLPDEHDAPLLLRLPRRTVDEAVLAAAGIGLEVTPEGYVAAYADGGGVGTLARSPLSKLAANAVTPEALTAEDRAVALARLEAELERALEVVRRARDS